MQILVKPGSGLCIPLEVEPCDTVKTVRSVIQDRTTLILGQDTLIYGGKPLEDIRTLTDCGIREGSILNLVIPLSLRGGGVHIFFKTLTGKTIGLDLDIHDTILKTKLVLQDKEGIPPEQQQLIFSGKELGNFHSLFDYGIKKESTIFLLVKLSGGMQISINLSTGTGSQLTLEVNSSDMIKEVKSKIRDKSKELEDLDLDLQLYFRSERLQDNHTLMQCGIESEASIDLIPADRVFTLNLLTCRKVRVRLGLRNTLLHMKKEVHRLENYGPDIQRIVMNGRQLLGDDQTLGDLGISELSKLYLILRLS